MSFAWMVEQVRPFLAFHEPSLRLSEKERPRTLRRLKAEAYTQTWPEFLTNPLYGLRAKMPTHDTDAWGLGRIDDSISGLMSLGGAKRRTPGECTDDTGRLLTELGSTNEEIHPSVRYRFERLKEIAPALKEFEYRDLGPGEGAEYVHRKRKNVVIPEYRIGREEGERVNLERRAAMTEEARTFLTERDRSNYGI